MPPRNAKGKARASTSELKMGPLASAEKDEVIAIEDEEDEHKQKEADSHRAEAVGVKLDDDGHASDTGSFQSDSLDPAMFDEEEGMQQPEQGSSNGSAAKKSYQGGFNAVKTFNGQYYTGMGIGMSHTWQYQPGIWKETKKEPDLWEIDYKTNKVRNHKAPSGSGAPVGTEYHWLIVASQRVVKVDANTYETHLTGSKYKLAHKSVGQANWSVPTVKGQREREVFLLNDAIRRVEGLPPVLSNEKIKVDKKEKGQSTLANFFGASPAKASGSKRKAETADPPGSPESSKKIKKDGVKAKDMA